MADYIEQRRRGWYFVIDIPEKLRHHYDGKKRHVQSLKTDSRSAAQIMAATLAAQWKDEFRSLKTGQPKLSVSFMSTLSSWRDDLRAANDAPELKVILEDVLEDEIDRIEKKLPGQGRIVRGVVRGDFILTTERLDEYILQLRPRVAPKTADMHASDIKQFAASFPTVTSVKLV